MARFPVRNLALLAAVVHRLAATAGPKIGRPEATIAAFFGGVESVRRTGRGVAGRGAVFTMFEP